MANFCERRRIWCECQTADYKYVPIVNVLIVTFRYACVRSQAHLLKVTMLSTNDKRRACCLRAFHTQSSAALEPTPCMVTSGRSKSSNTVSPMQRCVSWTLFPTMHTLPSEVNANRSGQSGRSEFFRRSRHHDSHLKMESDLSAPNSTLRALTYFHAMTL